MVGDDFCIFIMMCVVLILIVVYFLVDRDKVLLICSCVVGLLICKFEEFVIYNIFLSIDYFFFIIFFCVELVGFLVVLSMLIVGFYILCVFFVCLICREFSSSFFKFVWEILFVVVFWYSIFFLFFLMMVFVL